MKKLLMFTAMALVMTAPVAMAEDGQGGGGHHGGPHKGKMFEKADANGDGAVTAEEFDAFHGKVFEKMDVNGDGLITKEEQEARRAEWQEKMREHREKMQDGEMPEGMPEGMPRHEGHGEAPGAVEGHPGATEGGAPEQQ